ncbi:S-formylglutathione hydrolase FrmB [Kitasatospora sp. MAP12-15]|uniref:alpha/beta hydrolase n=1 Tax=unclassified Kitasatospora TaxID=2633591 RepID=UPI0024768FDF|nr:alpha/beta hydrolase-fold protein [Kitasatospora sp. MAP12-44]MDH6109839.1 S-formylglutathione hydrolase FrmB [Kitasatospora sp. MAP12-44]
MLALTGLPIQIVASLLAVAAFVATMWLWPRLGRRSWKALLGRIGAFFATQLMVIVAMGLIANSYFGFYSTWTDLLGTAGGPGTVVQHTPSNAISVTGEQKVYSSQGSAQDRSGLIQQVTVTGAHSGLSNSAFVYLPPQYFQPSYAKHQFPMALVLSGYPGTAEKLITLMKWPNSTLAAIDSKQLQPTILVMMRPSPDASASRDTECMDVPHGPQVETFFTDDLPKAMTAGYRIAPQASAHAVMGDSTGGYCALKFALRKPDAYGAAVALSADYAVSNDPTTGDLYGGSAELKQQNDLLWRLHNEPAPAVSLLLATSYNEDNYKATQAMVAAFKAPTKLATITLDSGGHNFHTWNREIPPALAWLGQQLVVPQTA